ncbi:MAG: ABC transporter ATP-binding protein [Acidimicrobiales bacterium]
MSGPAGRPVADGAPRAGTAGAPALGLRSVAVRRGGSQILGELDWDVAMGERWVVIGPNGAGKTTLMEVAGARSRPSSGTAEVLGQRLGRVDMRVLRARIGLASGSVARQLRPELSAFELVLCGADGSLAPWWSSYGELDRSRARALLRQGGLQERHEHPWSALSEGERQQILLARALMSRPELLLLDEPAAGLDLGARERFVRRLDELAAEQPELPVVMVTHHVEEVPEGATHALLLRSGRAVSNGGIEESLTSETLSDCFGIDLVVERHGGRWSCRARTGRRC